MNYRFRQEVRENFLTFILEAVDSRYKMRPSRVSEGDGG